MKVLVGTYRAENAEWIKEHKIYNLPLPDGADASKHSDFEAVVLYFGDAQPLSYQASYIGVVNAEKLKSIGYSLTERPHGSKYVLFTLGKKLTASRVLSDSASEVCVCSSRYTGVVDRDFYAHIPNVGGESIPNVFSKLKPFVKKWKLAIAFNPIQPELFTWDQERPILPPSATGFTAVELFAGAGGLSIGLEKAGINVVIANEIMPDFATTLRANHPNTNVINDDIHKINFKDELKKLGLKSVDVLSGGPPCQGFSTIGSKNRQDPRNSLFYEYIRAVAETNPKYTIFENVSGFKRMYDGFAYETLKKELDALGYDTVEGILNAADYGAPQVRYRTIVLGWKRGLRPLELPHPTHGVGKGLKPFVTLMDAIGDLPPLSAGGSVDTYMFAPKTGYQRKMRGDQKVLLEHNASNYGVKMQEILRILPAGGSIKDLPARLRPKSGYANTYARLLPDVPSPTITRNFGTPSSSRCVHPFQPRALSTREGARLQGFPDSYRFVGGKQSKNLQIGNAVPPILGEAIAQQIKGALGEGYSV